MHSATEIFQRPINRKRCRATRSRAKSGKAAVLGLGFGAAAKKFYGMVIRAVQSIGWRH